MHIHTVKVSFSRKKQPRDYEESAPAVELGATLDEGQDADAVCLQLMKTACTTVYAGLGMDVPAPVASKLSGGEVEVSQAKVEKTEPKTDKPAKAEKTEPKKTTPKKTEAKKPEPEPADDIPGDDTPSEAAAADSGASDDIPGDDVPSEAAAAPEEDEFAGMDDGDQPEEGMTAEALQSFITAHVSQKRIPVAQVKSILASYSASRTSDVKPEDRAAVRKEIEDHIQQNKK